MFSARVLVSFYSARHEGIQQYTGIAPPMYYPRQLIEVCDQPHAPVALSPGKVTLVPLKLEAG
jgi:hypothetical protein